MALRSQHLERDGVRAPPSVDFAHGVLKTGVHEFAPDQYGDQTAASGYIAALLCALSVSPVMWITLRATGLEHGRIAAHGLAAFGFNPANLIHVAAAKPIDALWTAEEALKSGALGAVVAETADADFTATRRLSLASASLGVPLFLLTPHGREGASAAQSRWRISPRPSAANPHDPLAPGRPRWRAVLERSRLNSLHFGPEKIGRAFHLEFDDETFRLLSLDPLAARPAAARPAGAQRTAHHAFARAG